MSSNLFDAGTGHFLHAPCFPTQCLLSQNTLPSTATIFKTTPEVKKI